MAEVITCPACKRQLQVPASFFGQSVQCPECRHQFTANPNPESVQSTPPAPASKPAPPFEDEPPRRRPYDDDLDIGYDDDDLPLGRLRHSSRPHRGGVILALGLIALVMFPLPTIVCGPMAWVMGNTDLNEIRSGRMDPSGEGMVQAGRVLGIVSTILLLVLVGGYCLLFGFLFTLRQG